MLKTHEDTEFIPEDRKLWSRDWECYLPVVTDLIAPPEPEPDSCDYERESNREEADADRIRLAELADRLGVPGNLKLARYVDEMQNHYASVIWSLERRLRR